MNAAVCFFCAPILPACRSDPQAACTIAGCCAAECHRMGGAAGSRGDRQGELCLMACGSNARREPAKRRHGSCRVDSQTHGSVSGVALLWH